MLPSSKPGQRVGRIGVDKDFDAVLLVLLDENFEACLYSGGCPRALSDPH